MPKRVPLVGDEKTSLHISLDRHRDVVLWKLEGLDDERLPRPMTPSGTDLLGLVKHLAGVERAALLSGTPHGDHLCAAQSAPPVSLASGQTVGIQSPAAEGCSLPAIGFRTVSA